MKLLLEKNNQFKNNVEIIQIEIILTYVQCLYISDFLAYTLAVMS